MARQARYSCTFLIDLFFTIVTTIHHFQYSITLDGRVLKTPGRNPLILPNLNLAMSIAAEWDAQTNKRMGIQPVNMPMMSIASTAIDQIQVDRTHAVDTCMRYLPTDTALFHAPDYDRILQAKQKKHFLPVLEWAQKELGLNLATSQSMAGRIEHPESAYTKLRSILENMVSSDNKPHKLLAW